jgi:hypothetical protein
MATYGLASWGIPEGITPDTLQDALEFLENDVVDLTDDMDDAEAENDGGLTLDEITKFQALVEEQKRAVDYIYEHFIFPSSGVTHEITNGIKRLEEAREVIEASLNKLRLAASQYGAF